MDGKKRATKGPGETETSIEEGQGVSCLYELAVT